MTIMQPRVVDLSHHNKVTDLKATAMAGIWGVIHKASQGQSYRDPDCASRREQARAAGLLWGAYHFNDGTNVAGQVENFLAAAAPDDETLLVLDFEDNPKSNMSIQQAVQFLRLLEQRTGRRGAIYSGNRLKENIARLSAEDRAYLCSHRLWLCQYGPRAVLPAGFTAYWLWQYTGDGIGPLPHSVSGISGTGIDLNAYDGDRARLRSEWTATDVPAAPAAVTSRADEDEALSVHARQAASDAGPESQPQINIRPQAAGYSLDVEIVQRKLDHLGYHDVGDIDGKWGGKTKGAIVAFLNDRGLEAGEITGLSPLINDAISAALAEGWTRPIATKRARATAEDIAPKVEAVKQGLWQRLGAKIATWTALGGAAVSGTSDQFAAVNDKLSPVKSALSNVPTSVWLLIAAGIAFAVWYSANRATQATVKDYNTGKIN